MEPDIPDIDKVVPRKGGAGGASKPRILLVDDEPAVLAALQRQLRPHYAVESAEGGKEAVRIASSSEPFTVVMTDMRMPQMDGVAVLTHMREHYPDTVRILLTGYADLDSAIAAVNDGNVFRFLTKPSAPDIIRGAIEGAVHQHNLILAERELLQGTLQGSVRAMLETLALANPEAFSRATRVKTTVTKLLEHMHVDDRWEIEVAAMLSQAGAVSLPPAVLEKLNTGAALEADEAAMVARLPNVAEHLLEGIPRLEGVRDLIHQLGNWRAVSAPIGTKVIQLAIDYDVLEARGMSPDAVIQELQGRGSEYGPSAIKALLEVQEELMLQHVVEIAVDELKPGMVLAQDLRTRDHKLLVSRGFAVTDGLLERISNFTHVPGLESSTVTIQASSS